MAIPGVQTAVTANRRKNPSASGRTGGDGGTTTTSTVRTRAAEGVKTASAPATASNTRRAQQKTNMAYQYGYNDGVKSASGKSTGRVGATRSDGYKYTTPTKVNYGTFTPGLAGNGWNRMASANGGYNNSYAALNALNNNGFGMNMNAMSGAQIGLGLASMIFGGIQKASSGGADVSSIGGNTNVYERANAAAAGAPKLSSTVPAGGGTPLENMKGAGDSSSLQSAITAARAEQSEVTGKLQTLKGEIIQLENDKGAAEQKLEQLDKDIKAQKEVVEQKQDAVKTAEGQVKEAKHSQESAKKGLEQAETQLKNADDAFKQSQIGVENAQTALSGAQTKLSSANARLAATPPTLTDGTPNPAYAQAKSDVAQAEAEVAQKKKDLTAAQELRDQKADEYKKANSDKTDAAAQLDRSLSQLKHAEKQQATAEEAVVQAKKDLETEEGKLETLKEEKDSAEGAIKKYDEAVKEQEKLEKQVAQYEKEIPKQEERLKKLQAKEDKELKSIDGDISKTQKEIDGLKAKGKTDKADEKQTKLDGLNARKEELQNIVAQRNFKTEMGGDGQVLKSGFINGEQVFMVGDKKVTAQEFEAAKKPVIKSGFDPNAKIEDKPINLASMTSGVQIPDKLDIPNAGATNPIAGSGNPPAGALRNLSGNINGLSYKSQTDENGKFTGTIGNKTYTSEAEFNKDLDAIRTKIKQEMDDFKNQAFADMGTIKIDND